MKKFIAMFIFALLFSAMTVATAQILPTPCYEGTDITVDLIASGTIQGMTLNGAALAPSTDYIISDTQITLFKAALAQDIKLGENQLVITYASGDTQQETLYGLPHHSASMDKDGTLAAAGITEGASSATISSSATIPSSAANVTSASSNPSDNPKTGDSNIKIIGIITTLAFAAVSILITWMSYLRNIGKK
jgi:hypothetical protein